MNSGNIGHARRPQYLFSGLTKCGVCGAGFIIASQNRLACFGARDKGKLIAIAARREELDRQRERLSEPPPLLHPQMADIYRGKVTQLAQALQEPESHIRRLTIEDGSVVVTATRGD